MTVRDYIRKFLLMNWKNHKIQISNPLELTILTFSAPLFTMMAVILRCVIPVDQRSDKVYEPIDLDRSWLEMIEAMERSQKSAKEHNYGSNTFCPELIIGWAPESYNIFEELMTIAARSLTSMKISKYATCEDLEEAIRTDHIFAGICFDNSHFEVDYVFEDGVLASDMSIKPVLNYTIILPSELRQSEGVFAVANWMTLYKDDPRDYTLNRLNQPYTGGYVGYVREGFIRMQKTITESFLQVISRKALPKVLLRRFPVLGRKEDSLMIFLEYGMALLIIMGYLFPSQLLAWQMVSEKQSQLRLFLINMNIGNIIHFLSWYFKGVLYLFISSLIVTLLLKVHWSNDHAVLTQTPWYIVLLVLMTYNLSSTGMVMMISSFFRDTIHAVRVVTIIWAVSYMPSFVLWNNPEVKILTLRYASFLLPNVVAMMVFECIVEREMLFQNTWDNISYDLNYNNGPISVQTSTWVFLTHAVIYSIVGMYLDMWRGVDRSTQKLKRPNRSNSLGEDGYHDRGDSFSHQSQGIGVNSTKIYEVEPSHRRFKIKIKKLCKRFAPNDRPALNLFTWNVYENEVTVLMGHNGCGKTTLLKILAGLQEPSRGTVMVSNYNIQTERKAASMELGIAFNSDMLLSSLTVMDNLRFICRVKGMHSSTEVDEQVAFYMSTLQLETIKNKRLRNLTQRDMCLVCICCAFVGHSSIILIDDVHSDLDKRSQALVWALINEEKSRRTIILVSNSPVLAENIADRMAIMSNGELKCTGTKPFLKNMYGHGYRLTCVKGRNCKIRELNALMGQYMPNLTIETNIGYKITFVLENKYEDQFPFLIDDLEENMKKLDVVSFRIRDTSMEEIFLRFGCEENDPMGGTQSMDNPNTLVDEYYATLDEADQKGRLSGVKLGLQQCRAIFLKRWILAKRHWIVKLFEFFGFLVAFLCTFAGTFIYGKNYELIPLTYNLSQLPTIDAFAELFSNDKDATDMHAYYRELLYWYDANVLNLAKSDDGKYALLNNSELTSNVNYKFMFGATFDREVVTAWFNNIPLHAAPFALNVVHNAVARHFFDEEATIDVTLKPLKFATKIDTFPPGSHGVGSVLAINLCFLLGFIWPALSIYLIRERCSTLKKQQFLAGARFVTYWSCTLLYDLLLMVFHTLVLMAMVAIYLHPVHNLSFYCFLMLVFVMGCLWLVFSTYLVAEICSNPCLGYMSLCCMASVGVVAYTLVYSHHSIEPSTVLQFFAFYVVAEIIFILFLTVEHQIICSDNFVRFASKVVYNCDSVPNCCKEITFTAPDTRLANLFIVLTCHLFVVAIAMLFVEFHSIMGFGFCRGSSKRSDHLPGGEDMSNSWMIRSHVSMPTADTPVQTEHHRVSRMPSRSRPEHAAVLLGICVRRRKVDILKNLDFFLEKKECVNISGSNSSGKTTLLKVLVGEIKMRSGRIWICGHSMERYRLRCYRLIGYCPQWDRLPAEYTPRELMFLMALIQGHRKTMARELSESLLRMLALTPCWNQSVRLCTSGQTRRLLFGVAVMGSPQLVLIDGVPAGIDPTGKRTVFTVTSLMQSRGSSFIYTHLNNLDAERLCQRTPVLLSGQLWMVGSFDEVSQNYEEGYQLEVRFKRKVNPNVSMSRTTWNRINHFPMSPQKKFSAFMEIKFPEAVLKREKEDSMVFQMPIDSTSFSEIFLIIRKDAFEMNIEDYFITRNMRMGLEIYVYDREFEEPHP
ncbi:hypothetical protein KR067_001677 [Drosophila pandora]|nr:hypothetical protein KR067_001677 [Drosophila pandora]